MINVVLADDHDIVRAGLVSILNAEDDISIQAEAADGVQAIELVERCQPDVLICDISMPRLNGIEVVRRVRQLVPQCQVLVLTMHEEQEYVMHMVRQGASGYILKDRASQELAKAVHRLAAGKSYFGEFAADVLAEQYRNPVEAIDDPYRNLTDREREVFHLVITGATTKDIARALDISTKTAENHRGKIMDKLQVKNTVELVRYAARKGLLD